MPFLMETARLGFRELTHQDFNQLCGLFNERNVKKFYPGMVNRRQVKQWITETHGLYKDYGHGFWAIELKHSRTFIGQMGIVFQKIDSEYEYEIGCILKEEFQNQGYAIEGAEACKKFLFEKIKANKLIALIHENNTASIQTAKRIGMSYEKAQLKQAQRFEVYSITQTTYEKMKRGNHSIVN